jgi:phosphoglycerate-specific signal transduction histidine kinase
MRSQIFVLLLIALVPASALAGCGESEEEKATDQICSARDDIAKQLDELKGLTLTTATTSQVRENLQEIRDDLSTIGDARADLSGDQRAEVEQANDAFRSTMGEIAETVARTTSFEDASAQLKSAFNDLATSYEETFGQIDCS